MVLSLSTPEGGLRYTDAAQQDSQNRPRCSHTGVGGHEVDLPLAQSLGRPYSASKVLSPCTLPAVSATRPVALSKISSAPLRFRGTIMFRLSYPIFPILLFPMPL